MARKYWVERQRGQDSLIPGSMSVEGDELLHVELASNPSDLVSAAKFPARHQHPHDLVAQGRYEGRRWRVVDEILFYFFIS